MHYSLCLILVIAHCHIVPAFAANQNQNEGVADAQPRLTAKSGLLGSDEWYFAYPSEYDDGYQVKIVDKSLDTRLANTIYTTSQKVSFFRIDFHKLYYSHPSILQEYESYISGPEVDQTSCKKHLEQMNELLSELVQINRYQRLPDSDKKNSSALRLDERHVSLARVLDSYGRYESGVLAGRADMIGSFEQCLETKLKLGPVSNEQVVGTRYCKAALGLNSDLDPRIRDNTDIHMEVGICLPNTCHSSSLKDNKHLIQRLVDSQFSMPESIYVNSHRKIEDLFCLNDGNTTTGMPLSGRLFLITMIAWILLLIGATYYAGSLRVSQCNLIKVAATSLDIKETFREFMGFDRKESHDTSQQYGVNLDALNVVKVFSMMLIVLCHSMLASNYAPNILQISTYPRKDPLLTLALSVNQSVDTFFVMSGLLFSYISFKKFKSEIESSSSVGQYAKLGGKLFFGRYLRLVPLYFVVFWFKKSVWLYIGTGPLGDYGFNEQTFYGGCKLQSWLIPFTPMSGYAPVQQQCIPTAWSLGCEIFFILVTTPALIMLVKRTKVSLYMLPAIGLVSSLMLYVAVINYDEEYLWSVNSFNYDMMRTVVIEFGSVYTNPTYRLFPVLIGLIAGYFLYRYEKEKKSWPVCVTKYATKLAITALLVTLGAHFMIPFLVQFGVFNTNLSIQTFFHVVLLRVFWALATCILLMRLATDCQGNPIAKLFSGRFGRMISKLSLAILLIHADLLAMKHIYAQNLTANFSYIRAFDVFLVGMVYTFVVSAAVHILIESPVDKLIRHSLQGGRTDANKKKRS